MLVQKLRQANLQSAMDPLDSGWILKNGQYKINWSEGVEIPDDTCNQLYNSTEESDKAGSSKQSWDELDTNIK